MSHRRPDAEEAAHLQYETEHTNPGSKSVIPYLIILLAATFVLLFVAWRMQERADRLGQSADSFRSNTLEGLQEEKQALQGKIDQLEAELKTTQDENTALASQVAQLKSELDATQAQLAALASPEPEESPAP